MLNRGSEWRKWDLHCHTPLDHEWINKPILDTEVDKQSFAKKYIDFAKEQNLAVIAITDHNFCSSMDDLLIPYIQEEAKNNDITILPGFEITAKDGSGIHLLVIFHEDTKLNQIFEIVKACFLPNEDLCPSSGVPVSKLSISEIKNVIKSSNLDSIFIFAHADSKNGVLDRKTIDGTRRIEEWHNKNVDICQLSKGTNSFNEGTFLSQLLKGHNALYKRDMSYIVASDCRTIEINEAGNGRCYLGEKFVWIKANPTFEGLKQVIYEPQRIKLSEINPNQKNTYQYIESITLKDEGELFGEQSIGLSSDLNSIIGGKSSGKSLLLYHLAKAVMNHEKFNQISLIGSIQTYNDLPIFELEVKWADGHISKLSNNDNKRPIVYIPQMYLNYMAEKKSRNEDFKQTINDILKSNNGYKEFVSSKETEILELEQKIDNGIREYFSNLNRLTVLQQELQQLGDKNAIEANIEVINKTLEDLRNKSGITQEENSLYSSLNQKNEDYSEQINTLNKKKELFNDLTQKLNQIKSKISTCVEDEFSDIKHVYQEEELTTIISDTISQVSLKLKTSLEEYKSGNQFSITDIDTEIEVIREKITENKNQLQPLIDKINNLNVLKAKEEELLAEQSKIKSIDIKIQEIEFHKQLVDIEPVINNYQNLFSCYCDIVNKNDEYKNISESIDLISEVSFNLDNFRRDFSEYITKNRTLENIFESCGFSGNSFIFNNEEHINNIKSICRIILEDTQGQVRFNQSKTKEEIIRSLLKNYFDISYDLLQGNDRLGQMSPGKKGIILFQLFLHMSSSQDPILIDQPEDNLDNRTVYQELNDFIKEKKLQRQIIIVSHNSNLVVSTDSENVIVAHQNLNGVSPKFEYINGSLENTFIKDDEENILKKQGIREHVCDILEGGEEAFKKREKKYNI